MISTTFNMFSWIIQFSFYIFVPFIVSGLLFFLYYYIFKGMRLKKSKVVRTKANRVKNPNLLIKLFILFPRRFILDLFNRDPDVFNVVGHHMFCGEQGAAKTMSAIKFALDLKNKFPSCDVGANLDVSFANTTIRSSDDIINHKNGELGAINIIDEIQVWFSSLESKNLPIDMLDEICQQRKQRCCIISTSQVFTRVSKAFREQVFQLYEPLTIMGCLTVVRVYKPIINDTGEVTKKRLKKIYCFVHDDYLRNCYDTYEKIERLNKGGFKTLTEREGISALINVQVN